MENMVTGVCAIVIAVICILGVFSDFKDTAAQRVALGLGCVASAGIANDIFAGRQLPGAVDVLIWCLAVHCVEAARKFWRLKHGKPS